MVWFSWFLRTTRLPGTLSQAQNGFWRQGVIPLVVGAFGESNTGLLKLLKTWARHAASGDLGATISPLANTNRKGGAFPIMHRQFLRAVGVTAATGNAALKLSRIHYLRSTAREAAYMQRTRTIASINPITLINTELAGISAMPTRDMVDSSSSSTATIRTCLSWRGEHGHKLLVQ